MKKIELGYKMLHELIGSKWVFEILYSIDQGHNRYSEILNSVPSLSATELRRKLKLLNQKQIIERMENGHAVHYHLSHFGEDIVHILNHLSDIGERYGHPNPYTRESAGA